MTACDEVLAGKYDDHFVVDVYQAGAGTSHNMNCNEVIANRANELLGGKRGEYKPVHPNDHVNMAQSTNDVIPTAIRLGALDLLAMLERTFGGLRDAFAAKGKEFDDIVKAGRTHLQDAMPIRLGQEFTAYAGTIDRNLARIRLTADFLRDLGIGGSAVGTGRERRTGIPGPHEQASEGDHRARPPRRARIASSSCRAWAMRRPFRRRYGCSPSI